MRHLDTVCKSYGGVNFFFWLGVCKIVSSTYVHIDFGDACTMMMVVLGKVQFWVHPPSFNLKGQVYDHWFQASLPITLFFAILQKDMNEKILYLFFRDEVICLLTTSHKIFRFLENIWNYCKFLKKKMKKFISYKYKIYSKNLKFSP